MKDEPRDGVTPEPQEFLIIKARTFQQAIAEKFGVPEDQYAQTVFRECLYGGIWGIRTIVRWMNPEYFTSDFELIKLVKQTTDYNQFSKLVNDHLQHNYPTPILSQRMSQR